MGRDVCLEGNSEITQKWALRIGTQSTLKPKRMLILVLIPASLIVKIMKSYIQSTQQDDCRCSSTSSCESDDTPPIRRTKIRKQKRKVKRKALQRGRPQGRLAHTSEDSDSTTSSSETPPRQRGNCKKSKSPPRRNTRAYSLTKCPSNSMQESKLLQFSRCRSNGVSLGRAPLPENRVENSEVDPWGSDDDDMLLRCCPRGRVATKLSGY